LQVWDRHAKTVNSWESKILSPSGSLQCRPHRAVLESNRKTYSVCEPSSYTNPSQDNYPHCPWEFKIKMLCDRPTKPASKTYYRNTVSTSQFEPFMAFTVALSDFYRFLFLGTKSHLMFLRLVVVDDNFVPRNPTHSHHPWTGTSWGFYATYHLSRLHLCFWNRGTCDQLFDFDSITCFVRHFSALALDDHDQSVTNIPCP